MFLIALKNSAQSGAFSVVNNRGEKVIYIFEQFDDALRFSLQLEENGYPETEIFEYDEKILIASCKLYNTKYAIISPEELVVPPFLIK